MAYDMLEAPSRNDCHSACIAMSSFCSRNTVLKSWYEWWFKRRDHVFRAFKPTNTPCANIAEVGHAQMTAWANSNTTLLDAAIDDVAYAVRQKHDLKAFTEGKPTGGSGISVNRRRSKQYAADMKRAEACARQLEHDFNSDNSYTFIPDSGIHRPRTLQKKRRTVNAVTSEKKRKVNVNAAVCRKKSLLMALRTVRKRSVRLPPESDEVLGVQRKEGVPRKNDTHDCQRQAAVNNQSDDQTFQVVFCTPAIKTCYGCHQPFRRKYRREPTNVILKVMCRRSYTNILGNRVTSWHRQAAYLHLKLKCMQNYKLHAKSGDITVLDDILQELSDGQRQVLLKFGVSV